MEVMIPYNEMDNFDFNSARSTPFTSPPSTPKPFNGDFYFSAPPSPTHLSQFYREFESLFVDDDDKGGMTSHVDEFAFDVSQELEIGSVSAEELFDGGMIKPSPILETRKKSIVGLSPRNNKVQEEEHPRRSTRSSTTERESRGKQRVSSLSNSSSRRSARSLSPMRTSQYTWEEEEEEDENEEIKRQSSKSSASTCLLWTSSSSKGSKKWRFKDFFLFRSASEGRASDKDPLKKYTAAGYREGKYSSFKGNETSVSSSSSSSSSSKAIVAARAKKGKVSAHELHYTVNRALSSDLKKKTFLPYKQGILGQLAFNPGFGLSRK